MALYRFGDRVPKVAQGAYVSHLAQVIGDVVIENDCYVGHGAILRGDYGRITLGRGTAVEENATIHIRPKGVSMIGEKVTIGHGALVHCNRIDDFAVIGMGAVLSFDVEIGEWAIVAEGCVIPRGMKISSDTMVVGVPATIVGEVRQDQKDFWRYGKQLYIDLAHRYEKELERIG
jgi:carbonic anhydrase/acetyltransferase-like protein (isoleucine patch superfamily)